MTAIDSDELADLRRRHQTELQEAEAVAARGADSRRRQAAAVEEARRSRECAFPDCHVPGLPRVLNGAPSTTAGILWEVGLNSDAIVRARLCDSHAAGVVYALGKKVHDQDPASVDRFAAELFGG